MKRLKDFFYDKNDILIALAILVIAALLIIWRMEVIMAYPQTLAEETGTVQTTEDEAVDDDSASDDKGSDSQNSTDKKDSDSQQTGSADNSIWSDGKLAKDVTVTVAGGSAVAAVDSLVNAGLFASYDEYSKICKAAGYTPENIKAAAFTFKAGSTQTDIAQMVTQ